MTMPADDLARLQGCFGMIASDNDAEALAAIARCKAILTKYNMNWNNLVVDIGKRLPTVDESFEDASRKYREAGNKWYREEMRKNAAALLDDNDGQFGKPTITFLRKMVDADYPATHKECCRVDDISNRQQKAREQKEYQRRYDEQERRRKESESEPSQLNASEPT